MPPSTYPTKAIPPIKRYKLNKNLTLKTILTTKATPAKPSAAQSIADFLASGGKITVCNPQDENKQRLLQKYRYR